MATYPTYVSEPGVFFDLLKECKGILALWSQKTALLDNLSHYMTSYKLYIFYF
jgi:hypothetical protein